MPRRTAIPLYKSRHVAFVRGAADYPNFDKGLSGVLHVGTGVRPDTIGHVHTNWFRWKPTRDGEPTLYLKVPASDPCRKYGTHEPCGDCNMLGHGEFEPKTPAGEGREILIDDTWTNPVTKEREYFPLKDMVRRYFAHTGTHAPDDAMHGEKMIGGDGVSKGTLNKWYRDIGAYTEISAQFREDRLRQELEIKDPIDNSNDRETVQIKNFGTDDKGNEIPDIISHDLRATFCTQLMRTDTNPDKAIKKTGHKTAQSMAPYISFANGEIDKQEETHMY
ncbi:MULTISPECIES: site-specific integrase [Natrialbaceae]|nr:MULTISPECIES: hypothetical protein [Natrialbaceae]